jgi:hypothetical protein
MREFKNVILENRQTGDCSSEALSGRIGGSLTVKFFLDLKLLNPLRQLYLNSGSWAAQIVQIQDLF